MPKNWFQPRQIVPRNASEYEKKLGKIFIRVEKIALKGKGNFLDYYKLVDEMVDKGDYNSLEQSLYYYYGIDCAEYSDVESLKKKSWQEILFQTESPFLIKLKKLLDKNNVYQLSYDIYSNDMNTNISLSSPLSITYSSTGLTSSFSLSKVGEVLYMNVENQNLRYINIERSIWSTQSGIYQPTFTEPFQEFFIGTYSNQFPGPSIKLDVTTSVLRDYKITAEIRSTQSYAVVNHQLRITQQSLLGRIIEQEIFTPDANYYLENSEFARIMGSKKTYLEVYKGDSISPEIFAYDDLSKTEDQNLLKRYELAVNFLKS